MVDLIANGLREADSFGRGEREVFIITTKSPFGKGGRGLKSGRRKVYYINGIYYDLGKLPKFSRLFWHFIDMFDVGSYFSVRRVLKKEKPDIVMTHNLKGVGYLVPAAIRSLKIKHIHTLHDIQLLHPSGLMFYGEENLVNGIFSKFYQFMCRRLFGSPNAVISPSKWLMEEHIGRGFFKNSKKVILPNPVSAARREARGARREEKIFRFLYVGLIEEHKGVLFLIRSFLHFEQSEKSLKYGLKPELLIVGDGSKLKQARELIGENKSVKLLGRMKNNEVMELTRSSDCLIMPSLCYENSPTVIYEAMSASLPVIASRLGGIPELVGRDLLFEPGNEEDLIDKIKRAIQHKDEIRKAAEAKQETIKNFSVRNYVRALIKLSRT